MSWIFALAVFELVGLAIALGPGTSPSRRLLATALVLLIPVAGPILAILVRRCRGGGIEGDANALTRSVPRHRPADVRRLGDLPPMLDRLLSSDATERLAAMVGLCQVGDPKAVSLLRWVVEHGAPDVALEAALSLEELDLRREETQLSLP